MSSETQNILSLLTSTFEKNAWHGPSVKEVLYEIPAEHVSKKLGDSHSIIELVAHMTAWRKFVIRRLEGDEHYTVEEHMNFPAVKDWSKTLQDLYESQTRLVELLKTFPGARLSEVVPHGAYRYTYYTLLHGIIHHDVYHIGQISLIKKTF